MNETRKQKSIRIIIIGISIIFVFLGLFLQQNKPENAKNAKDAKSEMKAVVVHQSEALNDPPLIVVYRKLSGEHRLILYKVERMDHNHFKAMKNIVIETEPDQLQADYSSHGVWVLLQNKWVYYNAQFEKEYRDEYYRDQSSNQSIPFQKNSAGDKVQIRWNNKQIEIPFSHNEMIREIYSLSADKHLLFLLYKNDIKVIVLK